MARRFTRSARRLLAATGIAAVVITVAATTAAAAPAGQTGVDGAGSVSTGLGVIRNETSPTAVAGSYLVVLKDTAVGIGTAIHANVDVTVAVDAAATGLAKRHGGVVRDVWGTAVRGFELSATPAVARRIAADPTVAYVEQNQTVVMHATQLNPPWNLDRIDQRYLPLDQRYTVSSTAPNVHAYILDTGILTNHVEFGGRATHGWDFVDNDANATDCNGHGTHMAGIVGGKTYGVAKGVALVAVRVLNCTGAGSIAGVISGINWVTQRAIRPAVANMSLGGSPSVTLDNALTASIASGISYAVPAGSSGTSACNFSPARVPTALTVSSTDQTDTRPSYANYGSCLDLFAPGVNITSAWHTSPTATLTISGTSTAAPHVAGAAALILATNPTYTSAQVAAAIIAMATVGVVNNAGAGSPNRLLFVR